jgi:alpha-1,6-mannosyltransferase
VPLGVDTELFHPGRRDSAWRREHGLADGDLLLLFAGRLDREKRIGVLLEMMERLPSGLPIKLAILGQGPQAPLVERAAEKNPRILALPFEGDRSRLARDLASADLYVSAARSETFGLSVIEAQASGLAVVGQRAGAMIDRVPPSTGILVAEPDAGALAAAVAQIIQIDFRRMGLNARRLVETQNPWERTFRRLFGLYESLHRTAELETHAPRSA